MKTIEEKEIIAKLIDEQMVIRKAVVDEILEKLNCEVHAVYDSENHESGYLVSDVKDVLNKIVNKDLDCDKLRMIRKGNEFENKVAKYYKDRHCISVRTHQSHSPFDIMAIDIWNMKIYIAQCKSFRVGTSKAIFRNSHILKPYRGIYEMCPVMASDCCGSVKIDMV